MLVNNVTMHLLPMKQSHCNEKQNQCNVKHSHCNAKQSQCNVKQGYFNEKQLRCNGKEAQRDDSEDSLQAARPAENAGRLTGSPRSFSAITRLTHSSNMEDMPCPPIPKMIAPR